MCICEIGEKIEKSTESKAKIYEKVAEFILDKINKEILKGLVPNKCVRYELSKIKKADFLTKDRISIMIQTKPDDGIFEADLIVKGSENFEILENNIKRVSIYGTTSWCVKDDDFLKNYCYCASNLNKTKKS